MQYWKLDISSSAKPMPSNMAGWWLMVREIHVWSHMEPLNKWSCEVTWKECNMSFSARPMAAKLGKLGNEGEVKLPVIHMSRWPHGYFRSRDKIKNISSSRRYMTSKFGRVLAHGEAKSIMKSQGSLITWSREVTCQIRALRSNNRFPLSPCFLFEFFNLAF